MNRFVDGKGICLLTLLLGLAMSLVVSSACAAPPDSTAVAPRLGVLPFANHTGRMEAVEVLVPGIHARLADAGIPFVSAEELRPLLRQYRIRGIGRIGVGGAALIRSRTGVNYLMLGSLDFYDERSLEVGVSLRILNVRTLELVKAVSVAATGEDYTGMFEFGRVTDIRVVADRVLDRTFEELGWPLLAPRKLLPEGTPRIAIIPFENMSEMPQADAIMANIVLSNLLAAGYVSLEPGFVTEVFLLRRTMARGQIDLETLDALRDVFSLDLTLTGVVDQMEPARGDLTVAVPSLAFGTRLLDAQTRQLRAAWEIQRDGADRESILGWGRVRSLSQLGSRAARDLIRLLDIELGRNQPEGDPLGE